MDFLFRSPLLTFDPRNNEEIEKHWEQILQAISYSSPDFALAIRQKRCKDMTGHQKQKLLKYLLRGRFRATPFGYWAGVGLGNWGSSYSIEKLDTDPIPTISKLQCVTDNAESTAYCLPIGFKKNKHQYVFWSFHKEKEGWLGNFIVHSKVVDMVYKWLSEHPYLVFDTFSTWFEIADKRKINAIWEHLIKSGLLITYPSSQAIITKKTIDLKINNPLTLPKEIKDRLEVIPKEMGALFRPVEATFMESFKAWFMARFDDRFVRMDCMMQHKDFWPGIYDAAITPAKSPLPVSGTFWESGKDLDLSSLIDKKEIENVRHLQAMFRIGKDEEIQVENIACNYPYVFMGRFGRDLSIRRYFQKTLQDRPNKDILFADVFLQESEKSQQISSHHNLYDYSIDGTGGKHGNTILPLCDLWVGVQEGKVVQLYSESHGKQVIPVIQHPLNPSQISHPVSRILWYIAQQNVVRFLPYTHPSFQDTRYTPKLRWGDICLQREKWIIRSEDLTKFGSLSRLKKEWHLPELITFGNHDRELVLDLKRPDERTIIEKEIRYNGKCHISTAEWVEHSPIHTPNKCMIYPQVITGWNFDIPYPKLPQEINFQQHANRNWVYVRIHLSASCLEPFMTSDLPRLVGRATATGKCQRWFFLYYAIKHQEIRVRFHLENPNFLEFVKAEIFKELESNELILSYNFEPYYPEESKFGKGIEISEVIFGMESEFILSLPAKKVDFKSYALAILSHIYFRLFMDHLQTDLLFQNLKQIKSTYSVNQKRKFKSVDVPSGGKIYSQFTDSYISILKTHPLYMDADATPLFLFHHLHLFINRLFLNKASDEESYLLYQIYSKMGKARAVGNSFPKEKIT